MQTNSRTCPPFSKSGLGAIRRQLNLLFLHIAPGSPCQSTVDYGNTKTSSMHCRLSTATLSRLALPGESNPDFPCEKSQGDNAVVQKKNNNKSVNKSRTEEEGGGRRTLTENDKACAGEKRERKTRVKYIWRALSQTPVERTKKKKQKKKERKKERKKYNLKQTHQQKRSGFGFSTVSFIQYQVIDRQYTNTVTEIPKFALE